MPACMVETAGALLIDAAGRVLLGLRAPWKRVAPDRWDAIGGHVEPGETAAEAMVREVREELGVTATSFRPIASLPEPRPELYGPAMHHLFAVTAWTGGPPANASDEHTQIRWFTAGELRLLPDTTDFDFPWLLERATAC